MQDNKFEGITIHYFYYDEIPESVYSVGPVDYQENTPGELTSDDILSALNVDDDPDEDNVDDKGKEKEDKKKDKENKEDEEKDDDKEGDEEKIEIEDEDEEKIEEDEEEVVEDLLAPLSRKLVLKKYPNIFKDFPQLEKGYYGNIEYRKTFPTVKEAQEAAVKLEELGGVEKELLNGDSSTLLKNLKTTDEGNFAKLVDNYLPTLEKVDERAYYHVIGNVIKRMIFSMASSSKDKDDQDHKDLLVAAQIVKGYMFGDAKIEGITAYNKEAASPEADKLKEDRNKFDTERLEARKGEITNRVTSLIQSTLKKHIDPRDSMGEYVKKNAVKDAQTEVDNLIGNDKEFQKIVDRLWAAAAKDNFSEASTTRVRNAYLTKAKTLLPQVIRKIRNEALKGSGRGSGKSKDDKVVLRGTKSAANNSGKEESKEKKKPGDGMSTLEFLSSD